MLVEVVACWPNRLSTLALPRAIPPPLIIYCCASKRKVFKCEKQKEYSAHLSYANEECSFDHRLDHMVAVVVRISLFPSRLNRFYMTRKSGQTTPLTSTSVGIKYDLRREEANCGAGRVCETVGAI